MIFFLKQIKIYVWCISLSNIWLKQLFYFFVFLTVTHQILAIVTFSDFLVVFIYSSFMQFCSHIYLVFYAFANISPINSGSLSCFSRGFILGSHQSRWCCHLPKPAWSFQGLLFPSDQPEKLQQTCPTCPLLLPNNHPDAMNAAGLTLVSYKRKSALGAGLGVKKVTRAAAQVILWK